MVDEEDNNENSPKPIKSMSQCSKELRVSLEPLDLEKLSQSKLSSFSSFSASEVIGQSALFNRRESIGGGSLQNFSPGTSVSTPSVSTPSDRRNISMSLPSSKRRMKLSKRQSPNKPLSQARVIEITGPDKDDFQKNKISKVHKKHKKKFKEVQKYSLRETQRDVSIENQEEKKRTRRSLRPRKLKFKLNDEASITVESDESSDETSRRTFKFKKTNLRQDVGLTEIVDLTSPRNALNEFIVFNEGKSDSKAESDILDLIDLNDNVNFLQTQSKKEMLESREIKKEMINDEYNKGKFFLTINGLKCDGTEEIPHFKTSENGTDVDSEKDDVESTLIAVGREQEELISINKYSTPPNHRRTLDDQQSANGLKKKSCSKRLFEDKELKEPKKGDLKFTIKRDSNGLKIKRGETRRKDIGTEKNKDVRKKENNEDEFKPKSETQNQKKKKEENESSDSSDDERENSPSHNMPTLEIYDPSEPISPTPRHLPKIIEVQKLDEPNLLDLNNFSSQIPIPSRCRDNPEFDEEELFSMVSNEAALNNQIEMAGESLLPLEPATMPNLEIDDIVQMMSEAEKDDIVEPPNEHNVSTFSSNAMNPTDDDDSQPPVLKKRKITSSGGSVRSPDKKMKLDRVVDGPQFGDPKYLASNDRTLHKITVTGVKASKTLDLNGDFGDSWIHQAETQVVDENKSKQADDETLRKPNNGLTNGDNDTDLDYSSYSSSSDEEAGEKVEKKERNKNNKSTDKDWEDDNDELEKDKKYEDAKNSEKEDEEENEKVDEDATSDNPNKEDLDDCLSIFYSDDEQLLKSPDRKISSKYRFPKTKPKTAPKTETTTEPAPAKNPIPKIAIEYSGSDSKNQSKPKNSKPDTPDNEVPKRKPSPIIFNSLAITRSKVPVVKNSSNVRIAPKPLRNPPQNNAIPKPIPRVRGHVPALREASIAPSTSNQIHPREVPAPPAPQPVTAEDWMLQDFKKDMAQTNCNGKEALFNEPIREIGPALNGAFPSIHPTNEYRQPGYTRHQSVQQTINTCNKDEMPSSVSASNILKPQSDVRMRVGHAGLDKQKVFENMCHQFMRCGKCPRLTNRNCPYDHRIQNHCDSIIGCSRDYLFSFVQLVINSHFEYYLKSTYKSFLESLDYQDACHMFKLLNTRSIIQTRTQVDAVITTMLGKQNAILSRVILDLINFSEDPQLKNMLFDAAITKLEHPGLFWDTFKILFKETDIAPTKTHVDVIIEECVMLRKNRDHVNDVCQYFDYLKHDRNVPFDISGNYFDRFISLIKKHSLNSYLAVFNIQDEDFLSPTSPNQVRMCHLPLAENATDQFEASRLISTTRPNEAQANSNEQMHEDQSVAGWKLMKIELSKKPGSVYHDMFGELHQDIFYLNWSLQQHDYVKAIDILKKYALELGKNSFYNSCYKKCFSTVLQIGKRFEEDGQFEHEKQFWEFVKDLLDVREGIRHQDYLSALHLFKKYVQHSNEAMRHRFSYVCYLLIREEFTMVEKYFTLIELAVRGGARRTLSAMLLDLGTRILLEIVDKGHWYHAYKLVKHLESVTCGASLTLLQAQIFLANQRPEKAFSLLKSTKLLFKDKKLWLVPPQNEDESLRVHVINALMKSLICNDVKKGFALFEMMITDQISIWRPIDLTHHANYLLLELALGYNTDTLVELCWLIMKYNILLEDSVFRLGVIMLTRHNIELGKVFFEFAANRGVYNILKNQQLNARVIRLILRSNSTEEELFLIVSDMLEQLSLHCGQGITGVTRRSFKVFFVFQRYPAANQLYQDSLFENSTKRDEEYRNARKVLEKVLQTRFNPSIRLVNQNTGRFIQLQQTTIVEHLKNIVK